MNAVLHCAGSALLCEGSRNADPAASFCHTQSII